MLQQILCYSVIDIYKVLLISSWRVIDALLSAGSMIPICAEAAFALDN